MTIQELKPPLIAPTIQMVVEPSCRYGHGLLLKQPSTYLLRKTAGIFQTDQNGRRHIVPSGMTFAVTLLRCPVRAYVEFFDPDEMATTDEEVEHEDGAQLIPVPYMGTVS